MSRAKTPRRAVSDKPQNKPARRYRVRTVKVSSKGQIAIPTDVRKALGIRDGDELVLVTDGERIFLEREQAAGRALDEDLEFAQAVALRSLRDVWDNEEDEVWNDV